MVLKYTIYSDLQNHYVDLIVFFKKQLVWIHNYGFLELSEKDVISQVKWEATKYVDECYKPAVMLYSKQKV